MEGMGLPLGSKTPTILYYFDPILVPRADGLPGLTESIGFRSACLVT